MGRREYDLRDRVPREPGFSAEREHPLWAASACQSGNMDQRIRYHGRLSERDYRMDAQGEANVQVDRCTF